MNVNDVLECQIGRWYPKFRNVSIRTEIIDLPEDFVSYLLEDGLYVPESAQEDSSASRFANVEPASDSDDDKWSEDQQEHEPPRPGFPQLQQRIRDAIEALGGAVLPKLNWSCPKDATWITASNSLRCTSVQDIFLVLKASDFVTHDLTCPFDHCLPLPIPPVASTATAAAPSSSPNPPPPRPAEPTPSDSDSDPGPPRPPLDSDPGPSRLPSDSVPGPAPPPFDSDPGPTRPAEAEARPSDSDPGPTRPAEAEAWSSGSDPGPPGPAAAEPPHSDSDPDLSRPPGTAAPSPPPAFRAPPVSYTLALRKWVSMLPAMEFRCFVANDHLIGVSQRDVTTRYSFLARERESISARIGDFFADHLCERFVLSHYAFDVYLSQRRVILVDFNVFGPTTDPLLFSWDELLCLKGAAMSCEDPPDWQLRLVEDQSQIALPYSQSRYPVDLLQFASELSQAQWQEQLTELSRHS